MKNLKRLIPLALVFAIASSITGCQKNTAQSVNAEYKYGKLKIQALSGAVCGAPSYIAFEKGFFKEEGLDVELVSGTLDENKTGLATGEFVVTNGDFQWFPSIQQGMNLKIIGGLHKGCIKIVLPPNSPIKTAADLKGKNIGVDEIGGTPMSVATIVLANAGINPQTEVTWKPYPLDQLNEAVSKGEVDAFAAWDPFGTLAVENNGYKVLTDISTDPLFAGKSCCFLYAGENQIKENPEKVKAIARAYQKADAWIKEHPEEAAKIEIDKKYIASDNLKLVTELIKSYDFEYTTDSAKDDISYFVKKLDKTGFLKDNTDPTQFANDTYYDILNK
ncbi:ABC transporter substrate-binding protein [Clostridium chromiireducens]|uniref:ABC transporter substrate-binding protein n=1 Tax=Clostridium chromiireducens TaxID=225345 RepID=UPI003AF5E93A